MKNSFEAVSEMVSQNSFLLYSEEKFSISWSLVIFFSSLLLQASVESTFQEPTTASANVLYRSGKLEYWPKLSRSPDFRKKWKPGC